jgi:hypothetical protein
MTSSGLRGLRWINEIGQVAEMSTQDSIGRLRVKISIGLGGSGFGCCRCRSAPWERWSRALRNIWAAYPRCSPAKPARSATGNLEIYTYWSTHRYQSTTLTVDEPSIDQKLFPTALKGGAVHGDKYWGDGGVSYIVYGGDDLQSEFQENTEAVTTNVGRIIWTPELSRAIGR